MQPVERRKFLKMAAAGSALAAAAALPLAGILEWSGANRLKFRAAVGMPHNPLPAYASFVVEGNLDLAGGTGTVRKSLYAGAPNAMSNILFPGTERIIRVNFVQHSGDTMRIAGTIDESQALGPRESRNVAITIDRRAGLARADFLGREMLLQVQ